MDPTAQGVLLLVLGATTGALGALAWTRVRRSRPRTRPSAPAPRTDRPLAVAGGGVRGAVVPYGVATVLGVLRSSSLVVDDTDRVVQASAPAYGLGLVRGDRVVPGELRSLIELVRADGRIREADLDLPRGRGRAAALVSARVAPLSRRLVLVLAEDRTRERRVEAVRRDFVANVSHELKTPIGALTLLAEAVQEAADDAEAVQRFSGRMQVEATRLTRLVQQIIELSRVQRDDALGETGEVEVDEIVQRAVDAYATEAEARGIAVHYDGQHGLRLLGNADQIYLALSNLVANAISYSPDDSKVVVSALPDDVMVDIAVSDEGIGIPADEIDRIFERFYRVDPARHRSTGGTGLGLSIVKHVAGSHGGDVTVWSEEGQGSTFTLSLPRHLPAADAAGADKEES